MFFTGLDTDFHDPLINFPTVTVCPVEPFDSNLVNITATMLASNDPEAYEANWVLLENITLLSYDNLKEFSELYEKNHKDFTEWHKKGIRERAFQIAIKVDEVFDKCKFRAEYKDCGEVFQPIYSERGLCFSFNPRYYGEHE